MRGRVLILMWALSPALAAQTDIRWLTVTPHDVSFTAVDPSSNPPTGTVTAQWRIRNGRPTRPWTLTVQALSAVVGNCGKVPLSAFRVRCASLKLAGNATGSCSSSPVVVSTGAGVLAWGTQSPGARTYTANLTVEFVDSWQYPGALSPACSLSLNYSVNAP